jgi:hypothetical protein
MYLDLLLPDNHTFANEVGGADGASQPLQYVLEALSACQAQRGPDQVNLMTLLITLDDWRTTERHEYNRRGRKHGVAYRLWMEAKQRLKNAFDTKVSPNDPPMPKDCPGSTTLGVYVPVGEGKDGQMEICHGFAYRWLVASGKLQETVSAAKSVTPFNSQTSLFLYPGGGGAYPAARVDGVVQVQAGDLIGMFFNGGLVHSLIAVSATRWFAANNSGTFGKGPGRTEIDFTQRFPTIGTGDTAYQVGWVGQGPQFKRVDGHVADVIYRRL